MRYISKIRTVDVYVTADWHELHHTRSKGMFIIYMLTTYQIPRGTPAVYFVSTSITRPPSCFFYTLPYCRYAFSTHHMRTAGEVWLPPPQMFVHECCKEMVLRCSPSDFQTKMLQTSCILDRRTSLLSAQLIILNFITLITQSEKYQNHISTTQFSPKFLLFPTKIILRKRQGVPGTCIEYFHLSSLMI